MTRGRVKNVEFEYGQVSSILHEWHPVASGKNIISTFRLITLPKPSHNQINALSSAIADNLRRCLQEPCLGETKNDEMDSWFAISQLI